MLVDKRPMGITRSSTGSFLEKDDVSWQILVDCLYYLIGRQPHDDCG
jgi:hypothetical protein